MVIVIPSGRQGALVYWEALCAGEAWLPTHGEYHGSGPSAGQTMAHGQYQVDLASWILFTFSGYSLRDAGSLDLPVCDFCFLGYLGVDKGL